MLDTFYRNLPPIAEFADLADASVYSPVPSEWYVVIADVVGSTQAVADGRYRDVNYVGAASIAAALNASKKADLPFVFGGDGATLLVPPDLLDAVLGSLAALQRHAEERLGLSLRVGSVSITEIRQEGHDVVIARWEVSEGYAQALFSGSGLIWAEHRIKSEEFGPTYASTARPSAAADPYEGLECRWQDVISPFGETVSLLVQVVAEPSAPAHRAVLDLLDSVYGGGETRHPISLDRMCLNHSPSSFGPETKLRKPAVAALYRAKLTAQSWIGRWLIRGKLKTSATDWGQYPALVRGATDYRKYDGVLRMVIAGTTEQRQALETALNAMYKESAIAYGIHVSDRATLTCLVYERMGRQVHFVDGGGGGYTSAAVPFKERLRELSRD